MILNEREMQMAKELARELVEVKNKSYKEVMIDAWNKLKDAVIEVWHSIKSIFQEVTEVIEKVQISKKDKYNWYVPKKIDIPNIPHVHIPKDFNIRSSI